MIFKSKYHFCNCYMASLSLLHHIHTCVTRKHSNRMRTTPRADLRGARGMPPSPGGPNSFNFMQFLGNFGKIVCWRPPWGVGAPSSGKSWIRYCTRLLTVGGCHPHGMPSLWPKCSVLGGDILGLPSMGGCHP